MQQREENIDLDVELALSYSKYFRDFTHFMDKITQSKVATQDEFDIVRASYDRYETILKRAIDGLDKDQKTFFATKTPPFRLAEQFYHQSLQSDDAHEDSEHQQAISDDERSDSDASEDPENITPNSFDSNGSESSVQYQARLLAVITALYKENPIKNLAKMLEHFKLYQSAQSAPNTPQKGETLADLELNQEQADILCFLAMESQRSLMMRELEDKISQYQEEVGGLSVDNVDFTQIANSLLQSVDKLISHYAYYITVQQQQFLDTLKESLVEKFTLYKKNKNEKSNFGIAITSPFTPSEAALVTPSSASPNSLFISPSPTRASGAVLVTPGSTSPSVTDVSEVDLVTSGSISPVPPLFSSSKPFQPTDNSDFVNQKSTVLSSPGPTISSSIWFLIALSSASLVAGIVLLALAGSLSSTLSLAGFACVGGAAAIMLFSPNLPQVNEVPTDGAAPFNP